MKKVKVGKFVANYPLKELSQSLVNRDIVGKHSEQFGKKIQEFGFLVPIIADHKGNIIEGHHRALSAESIGMKTVPVYIVNWVDTKNLDEYQKYIISLNNNNRKWTPEDYLKSFSRNKKQYKLVYNRYIKHKENLSLGAVLQCYFNHGSCIKFRSGDSKVLNLEFSDFILKGLVKLRKDYGAKKVQAYTTRQIAKFLNHRVRDNKNNYLEAQYILDKVTELAEENSPILSSIEFIEPFLKEQLNEYRK